MTLCSTPHPERADVECDKSLPCYGFHANALVKVSWPGNPLPPRAEKPTRKSSRSLKAELALIAQRVR